MAWITQTFTTTTIKTVETPGWDAGARSIDELSFDGGFTFSVGQAIGIVCGFNTDDKTANYREIQHGFLIETNRFKIIESGVEKSSWSSYSTGDIFKVSRSRGVVEYYCNDVLIYTSLTASTGTVFLDCSMYAYLDSILCVSLFETFVCTIDVELSPLIAESNESSNNYIDGSLSPLSAEGEDLDVNQVIVELSALIGKASVNDLNNIDILLLPLTAFGEDTLSYVPDYNSINIELRALQVYGLQYDPDPALLEGELSPLIAFGSTEASVQIISGELLPLTVETYLDVSNYLIAEWPNWQVSAQSELNMVSFINIPSPILLAKANDFDNMRVDVTIPAPILTAYTGVVIPLEVPAPVLTATGTVQAVARAEIEVPAPELTAAATNSTLASVALVVPAPILTAATGAYASIEVLAPILAATAVSEGLIWVDLTVPAPEITASGTVGGVMSVVLEVPAPILTATGIVGAIAQVTLMVPAPILTASAQVSPGVGLPATTVATETTYTVNLTTGAVTTLLLGGLDKLITAHGRLYGLRSGELIRLDGDLDGSATIPATVRFAQQTFGTNRAKRLSTVYLDAREDDGLTLEVVADENAAWRYQTVTDTARAYGTHKVKVGRGVKFHTAGLVIKNRNGGRMDIGGMELLVDTGAPRPKS